MEDVKSDCEAFMDHVNMEQQYRDLIMSDTAARLFGIQ